jgi:DNA-3-methyladenine glycosylase II
MMKLPLATKAPFSFQQTLTFVRRFPPCQGDYVITDDSLTAAVTVAGRPAMFVIRDGFVEVDRAVDAPALLARASDFIGARDDLRPFYDAAAGDPPFRRLVDELYGLHHVRFLTLEEIAVYCVMMQRNPITRAAQLKRRFFERFGLPIAAGDTTLYALPSIDELAKLDGKTIGEAIGHAPKGEQIASVVRGVAKIGERFLREAPYAAARDELLEIKGVGPFSAAAILLRGLGRMDELPNLGMFADDARALYGADFDEAAIRARYGAQLGYWSFYLKTGISRRVATKRKPTARMAPVPMRRSSSARRSAARRPLGSSSGSFDAT